MKQEFTQYFKLTKTYIKSEIIVIAFSIFLLILSELFSLASPLLTRFLIDDILLLKNTELFVTFIIITFTVLLIILIGSLGGNYLLIKSVKKGGAKLKLYLLKKLQNADLDFYRVNPSGQITYRLLNDTGIVEESWIDLFKILPTQLLLLSGCVIMLFWKIDLTLFVLIMLITHVVIITKFKDPLLKYALKSKRLGQELNGFSVQHFTKINLIQSLAVEKKEQLSFFRRLHKLIIVVIKNYMIQQLATFTVIIVNNIWSFGILIYGGIAVIYDEITLGTLIAFLLFASILFRPVSNITRFVLSFQDVYASVRRLKEFMMIQPSIKFSKQINSFRVQNGIIDIKNLSFGYNSKQIIDNLSVHINSNEIFALIGPSGVGKTTLSRLLVRFYDPLNGSISIDGKDIRAINLHKLRKSVLLMLQNEYVFNTSLKENITYGVLNYTKNELNTAIENAGIDFISRLPDGLNTIIGEDGINISGGEAQRIALARAFLISPKVIILDEPTCFLDPDVEKKIKSSLLVLKEKSTIIIITHRISIVSVADKIGIMKKGKIQEILEADGFLKKNNIKNGIYFT